MDTVYLGENVCSKRQPFFDQHIEEMAERLQRGGKRVVHSGLAEVMLKRERKSCHDMAEADEMEIEVNNAAGLLSTMLQSVQPQRDEIGSLGGANNTKHPAFFAQFVVVKRMGCDRHGLRLGTAAMLCHI